MTDPIYLDHNATTPIAPQVLEAMLPYLERQFGNPSSSHPLGRAAAQAVARAREQVAALLGCAPDQIVFTSGGTEANNLALRGLAARRERPGRIVTTNVEHPAIEEPCRLLETRGWEIERCPVDGQCLVDAGAVAAAIDERTALVTVMHANNETGALQPLPAIAEAARARGVPFHSDAAQSAGKVPVRVDELGVDLLSLAGHKLYAPKGVGALYVGPGLELAPVLRGAGQERGLRPGTENVAGIVGLGAACELAIETLAAETTRLAALGAALLEGFGASVPGVRLNGPAERRLPNTFNVSFPGVSGNALLARCPELAASTGAACHEGGEEIPSGVLTAMGLGRDAARGAVRLTLGRGTTAAQIERASAALVRAHAELVTGGGAPC